MNRQKRFATQSLLWGILLAVVCTGRATLAADDSKPWTLDSNNWQLGKDLLPEVILTRGKSGEYYYKVVPVDPDKFKQNYSKKFWEASESNAGKFDVDAATCGLKDVTTGKMPEFYFGYPFPKIDPKEPTAACKMAWNFTAANQKGTASFCCCFDCGGANSSHNSKFCGGSWRIHEPYSGQPFVTEDR